MKNEENLILDLDKPPKNFVEVMAHDIERAWVSIAGSSGHKIASASSENIAHSVWLYFVETVWPPETITETRQWLAEYIEKLKAAEPFLLGWGAGRHCVTPSKIREIAGLSSEPDIDLAKALHKRYSAAEKLLSELTELSERRGRRPEAAKSRLFQAVVGELKKHGAKSKQAREVAGELLVLQRIEDIPSGERELRRLEKKRVDDPGLTLEQEIRTITERVKNEGWRAEEYKEHLKTLLDSMYDSGQ